MRKRTAKAAPTSTAELTNPLTRAELDQMARREQALLIQALIPIGLMEVTERLQREVEELLQVEPALRRHGANRGSVVLGQHRIPIEVPRLRGPEGDVPLEMYSLLHQEADPATVYRALLRNVSCRGYADLIAPVKPRGLSKSTVSRRFVKASGEALQAFQQRNLQQYDIVAMFIDGTTFADQMIVAMGVCLDGRKIFLGFVQSATENSLVIKEFLLSLKDRGLNTDRGLLAICDGSKGIISALDKAFSGKVVIQRCQWHKRENVVGYLPKENQVVFRSRLQAAYDRPTYKEAKNALAGLLGELEASNQNAAGSLREGLEQTISLQALGIYGVLGKSLKTTNCLESANAAIQKVCSNVDRWRNSDQQQRWLASALLQIEPRLQRIRGCQHLGSLREALKLTLKK